jgi:phosphatidylserine/phosphatidylglycerophosphate/cardiolipin synthase-like enzyme
MDLVKLNDVRQGVAEWQQQIQALGRFDPDRVPPITVETFDTVEHVVAAVSPDCSYRMVKAAIEAARHEVLFYIYNVSAEHLLDLLRAAKARGVALQIMYDVTDTRGDERAKLEALGVTLKEAPSSGQRQVFTVCHQKFAVIDESIVLLGSANWAGTSIPEIRVPGKYKKGNRPPSSRRPRAGS